MTPLVTSPITPMSHHQSAPMYHIQTRSPATVSVSVTVSVSLCQISAFCFVWRRFPKSVTSLAGQSTGHSGATHHGESGNDDVIKRLPPCPLGIAICPACPNLSQPFWLSTRLSPHLSTRLSTGGKQVMKSRQSAHQKCECNSYCLASSVSMEDVPEADHLGGTCDVVKEWCVCVSVRARARVCVCLCVTVKCWQLVRDGFLFQTV